MSECALGRDGVVGEFDSDIEEGVGHSSLMTIWFLLLCFFNAVKHKPLLLDQ